MTGRGPRRRRRKQVLGLVAAGLVLVVVAGFLIEALNQGRRLRDAFPLVEGTALLAGLTEPVLVIRDPRGIPHIDARSEEDAYRALGFVHGQERLAQLAWLRRSAQGRLAEVVGPEGLAPDREARIIGISRHAEREVEDLPDSTRAVLRAYAEGVNARIDRIRAGRVALPVALAEQELEPWTEADSVAVVKLYAWALAGTLDDGLVLQDLIERLGGFGARPFYPPGVGIEGLPQVDEALVSAQVRPRPAVREPSPGRGRGDALRRAAGLLAGSLGSSAFVLSGRHTRSGRPILAADSHLPAQAPSLLFQAHLSWPGGEVAGATIPGVPLFWTGHNGRVAWAAVHAGAVVADLYVETLDAAGSRYHDGRRWRDLAMREEEIEVRGAPSERIVVRETRHGPLVEGLVEGEREPLALAWTGARRGDSISSFLRVARARDAVGILQALEHHHEPVVAVAYADAEGGGGVQMAGWIPRRSLPTGLVPVPGRNRWYDWRDPVPFDQLPLAELGDQERFAVAADARLTNAGDPVVIEWLWRTGARTRRIQEILRGSIARGPLELREVARLQRDVSSPGHRELVEAALDLAGPLGELGREERWVAESLRRWDGECGPDSLGATVYHVFVTRLLGTLLEPQLGPELTRRYLAIRHVEPVHLLRRLLAVPPLDPNREEGGSDPPPAPDRSRALKKSLRDTWVWLSVQLGPNQDRWGWGRVHRLSFRPQWSDAGWERSRLGPFPAAGDGATVAVAEYDLTDPFHVRAASTFHFVVDLAVPQEALTSLAPGQSEHPGHPQSVDGIGRWLEGRPRLLATSPLLLEETAVARLRLEPRP